MRILQVVTLLSPDGAFGGPVRVAFNQSAELIDRGHSVTIAAACRGYAVPPTELDHVPVALFPARKVVPGRSFAGTTAPGLGTWFRRHRSCFDLVHVHLGRDLVGLPLAMSARRHRLPYVVQTHGMITPSQHPLAAPLDAAWTRRVLRDAGVVFYLTPTERAQLTTVAGAGLRLRQLLNGVPDHRPAAAPEPRPEVMFAARMHPRKRPMMFVDMATTLLNEGVRARFTLVGPDEGEGERVRAALSGRAGITWEGPLPPSVVPDRLARTAIYVLPSVDEPYPMTVLEAMSVGVPVVIRSDCGLAPFVRRARGGLVVGDDTALADTVRSLLADPARAQRMGRRGQAAVRRHLGMRTVGDALTDVYTDVLRAAS